MMGHQTIPVGTHVFIIDETTRRVKEAVIVKQEWWQANPDHPVYYDLVDTDGVAIYARCTGNWHFNEVYRDRTTAENRGKR